MDFNGSGSSFANPSKTTLMKQFIKTCAALMALGCSGIAVAGGEGWISDFAAAKKEAAESKRDLLVDFTGSDWCGWCIKLNKEVFSHDAFKNGVKDKFVLVEIDFPQDKTKLSAETLKQNEELGKLYDIKGYPTILLCDADGKPFGVTGYQAGGPEAYVKHLDDLRTRKAVRDESFQTAAKAQGVEKAKALVAALAAMGLDDVMVGKFYGDIATEIKAADPKDETGFAKAEAEKARNAAFEAEFMEWVKKDDFDGALAFLEKSLKGGGFGREITQKMMVTRAQVLAQLKRWDDAIKAVDEAKAFAPDSPMAADIDQLKQQLEKDKSTPATAVPAEVK